MRLSRLVFCVSLRFLGALAGLASQQAVAARAVPHPGLRGEVGAGLSSSSGVALTNSINSDDRVEDELGLWGLGAHLSYNYFAYNHSVGVNRLVAEVHVRHALRHALASFVIGSVRYDHNLFDGYNYYTVEMLNAGRRVVHTKSMHLDLEAGGGARQNSYPNGRPSNDEPVADVVVKYVWHMRPGTRFSQNVSIVGARTGTLMTSTTGVTTDLIFHLALKFSEQIVHYTSLPSSALMHYARTTTFTTLNLIYHIGS